MSPCEQASNPAARLALASIGLAGIALLLAGLLQPDHPMPPIRTAADQTPVSRPMHILATSTHIPAAAMAFQPVATPKSAFYVGVSAYALLAPCGLYRVEVPNQPGMTVSMSTQPVPNCAME